MGGIGCHGFKKSTDDIGPRWSNPTRCAIVNNHLQGSQASTCTTPYRITGYELPIPTTNRTYLRSTEYTTDGLLRAQEQPKVANGPVMAQRNQRKETLNFP